MHRDPLYLLLYIVAFIVVIIVIFALLGDVTVK
jgi:hypothetical protein